VLAPLARAVVTKGGITSAEVARTGLDKNAAWVAGQIAPGVSLWVFPADVTAIEGRGLLYGVVPGNIGEAETLREVVDFVTLAQPDGDPVDKTETARPTAGS
jgi:uncharacterized protein YgbK (DUF1537 family)